MVFAIPTLLRIQDDVRSITAFVSVAAVGEATEPVFFTFFGVGGIPATIMALRAIILAVSRQNESVVRISGDDGCFGKLCGDQRRRDNRCGMLKGWKCGLI